MGAQAKNPFALKVGQLMTGFGAGCGIGVGVGYPIALGSIPVLGEMMSATSSAASGAFGGVGHKAFGLLTKLGIKNLKAGVGCGVGIGHGFGVGIALKPGVSQQIMHSLQCASTQKEKKKWKKEEAKACMRAERLSAAASKLQKYLPSAEGDTQAVPESLPESSAGESFPSNKGLEAPAKSAGSVLSEAFSSAKNEPAIAKSSRRNGEVQELRQENEILRTLLRHQQLIEDLKDQNASILRVLSEQFDVHVGGQEMDPDRDPEATPSNRVARKNETFHSFHSQSQNPHRKCFDCRISARRRR